VLATHGRAIWILDHLSPIQEYAAAQTTAADAKLFSPPSTSIFRRPARDRNYEFWGDQTFFGENPPQAAVISWHLKKDVGEVKLRITDAVGREIREISGPVLANSNKAGIQSACWDLRVQPGPAPAGRGGQGGGRGGEQSGQPGAGAGGQQQQQQQSPFGAGCGGGGGGFGGFGGGGGGNAGPYVLPGTYTVALIVDGTTIETKSLRVAADPEVVLTDAERKKLFDLAMEMHDLHRRATDLGNALMPFNTRLGELAKELEGRTDLPADVKAMFDSVSKEVSALVPKFAPPAGGRGGRGGGGGGAADNPVVRLGTAKNGLMAGMWPTQQTMTAYADAKAQMPKLIADANAVFGRASALSGALAKLGITLTVPMPPALKTTSSDNQR
jgi:hypothetical protein